MADNTRKKLNLVIEFYDIKSQMISRVQKVDRSINAQIFPYWLIIEWLIIKSEGFYTTQNIKLGLSFTNILYIKAKYA